MTDLIAALSTAPAPGAIGILRISGPGAIDAAEAVFRGDKQPLHEAGNHQLILGSFLDELGRVLDRGMALAARAPGSYTGEELVEFHCHGSLTVLGLLLGRLYANGARPARPGEFTQRAFLNGKLDLVEAEAVMDLIQADSAAAARNAAGQLQGAMSGRIAGLYDALLSLLSRFQAEVDYPEEDIDPLEHQEAATELAAAEGKLSALLEGFARGHILRDGVRTVLLGRPNAGKSSLLNALAGFDRAIVTPIPGTTRDTVEERVALGDLVLRLTDTAGLRETADPVEVLGVERSRQAAKGADLALLLLDGSAALGPEDDLAMEAAGAAEQVLLLRTKADLPQAADLTAAEARFGPAIPLCAPEGRGISELCAAMEALFPAGQQADGSFLTNLRQAEAVQRALKAVRRAREGLACGLSPDAVLLDAEAALQALGELSGRSVGEDLVARIFERFCVGK